jgi:hypothetical protein
MAIVHAPLLDRWPGTSGRVFPWVIIGSTNSRPIAGMGVQASLGADAFWYLLFRTPNPIPAGTCKLRLTQVSLVGGTQACKVNPGWASVAYNENYDTITLNAEGTQTLSLTSSDANLLKQLDTTLDADTLVANEFIYIRLTFETSGWTLAQASVWNAEVIWET